MGSSLKRNVRQLVNEKKLINAEETAEKKFHFSFIVLNLIF